MFWDFLSLVPESSHQVTILFSDRGTPYGYRHMNGYGSHTFRWVNNSGEAFWIKYHYKTDQGIKNFIAEDAAEMTKENPDFSQKDLFNSIKNGQSATWSLKV